MNHRNLIKKLIAHGKGCVGTSILGFNMDKFTQEERDELVRLEAEDIIKQKTIIDVPWVLYDDEILTQNKEDLVTDSLECWLAKHIVEIHNKNIGELNA